MACGYSQIDGEDYTENYTPVINDITWRVLLIVMLLKKYDGKIINIEVAFLHGKLEEEIYMDCPLGLEVAKEDECVRLLHTIYGLVQSSRLLWKKLVNVLKNMIFKGGYPNPCLMWIKNYMGMIFIALYVDDFLYIRYKDVIVIL